MFVTREKRDGEIARKGETERERGCFACRPILFNGLNEMLFVGTLFSQNHAIYVLEIFNILIILFFFFFS